MHESIVLLPNSERAFIHWRKLVEYILAPEHPVGGHKAILFERLLGMTVTDAHILRRILLDLAANAEASRGRVDEFGERYLIDFTLACGGRCATVRAAWIIRPNEDFPRLTSCFIV